MEEFLITTVNQPGGENGAALPTPTCARGANPSSGRASQNHIYRDVVPVSTTRKFPSETAVHSQFPAISASSSQVSPLGH